MFSKPALLELPAEPGLVMMGLRVVKDAFFALFAVLLTGSSAYGYVLTPRQSTPKIVVETPLGDITIELFPDPDKAPVTVDNILQYVNAGFYDNLIIHRVINDPNFGIVQGGGYLAGGYQKLAGLRPPIINESYNGLSNLRGTVAMARATDPNSAQSQFYINTTDNIFLDRARYSDGYGYCVFGQVISGMNVVDQIVQLPLILPPPTPDLPTCPYYSGQWVYTYKIQMRMYVGNDGNDAAGLGSPDSPLKTIQKGIDVIAEPGHVVLKPATYTGAGNRDLDLAGKAITVRAIQPRDAYTVTKTVIDCQANASNKHRAFYFHTGEEPNSVVQGLTITHAYHDNGAAIYCDNSSPTIKNCTLTGNTAGNNGGAIYCFDGNAVVANCTLTANSAGVSGGGACFDNDSNATLQNAILWNNLAPAGQEISLLSSAHPSKVNVSYTDIRGEQDYISKAAGCTVAWGLGNIDIDPCFVNAAAGDYHLQSQRWQWADANSDWVQGQATSPCIDAGNPGSPPYFEFGTTSIRIDMGSYGATTKASIPPAGWQLLADIDNDGFVDLRDFAHYARYHSVTGDNLPGDLNRNKSAGITDLNKLTTDWLRSATWYWPDRADINNDKAVNFRDFSLLAADWLSTGADLLGDLNGDLTVDFDDLMHLAGMWLQPVPR